MAKYYYKYVKNNEDYFAYLDHHLTHQEGIEQRCLLRDLQEQGTRAVHRLIDDPDPAWMPDVDHRVGKGGRNSKDYTKFGTLPEDYKKKWYED